MTVRSIPYLRDETNAAGPSAVDAHTTGSESERLTNGPQPSSAEMGVWDDHNEPEYPADEMVVWDDGSEVPLSSLMLQDRKTVGRGADGRLHGGYPF